MFYKYEIRNNGKEDILYLYLNMAFEFAKELQNKVDDIELTRRTSNFIKNNNIDFKGDKVFLVIDGIVVKTLNIKSRKKVTDIEQKNNYTNDNYLVTIKLIDNSIIEITLEEYLLGVLCTFYQDDLMLETLKAISILFRTYAFKMMDENHFVEANSEFAIYNPIYNYKTIWDDKYEEILSLLKQAIKETDTIFLTYNSNYILPFVHYSNSGKTLENKNYPYLHSVKSLWDITSDKYLNILEYSYEDLSKILNIDVSSSMKVQILELEDNLVKKIKFNNKIFTGEELVKVLNLNSLEMIFIFNKDKVKIICKGCGHFLGLSIFGANELAKNYRNYIDIINYYYPTVKIMKYKQI